MLLIFALIGDTDIPCYVTRSLKEMSIDLGIPYSTLTARLSDGRAISSLGIRIVRERVDVDSELLKLLK